MTAKSGHRLRLSLLVFVANAARSRGGSDGARQPRAPIRHPIAWQDPDFYDPAKIDAEMHRVFDICHGCRRCFNLCDRFPRLFDLIDASATDELDGVEDRGLQAEVVDACTLCDMCFMTKCPYVPPHEFNLDFPHLMLRYRAAERKPARSDSDRRAARRDRPQRQARGARGADRQLGRRADNRLTRADAGEGRRHRSRRRAAEIPRPTFVLRADGRRARGQPRRRRPSAARRCSMPPASSTTTIPSIGDGGARGAGEERRRDRGGLSALLRHAAARAGRSRRGRRAARDGCRRAAALDRARATTSSRWCRPAR